LAFSDHDNCAHTLSKQVGNIHYIEDIGLDTNKSIVRIAMELMVISDLFSKSECTSGDDLENFDADGEEAIRCNDDLNWIIFWVKPLLVDNNE